MAIINAKALSSIAEDEPIALDGGTGDSGLTVTVDINDAVTVVSPLLGEPELAIDATGVEVVSVNE